MDRRQFTTALVAGAATGALAARLPAREREKRPTVLYSSVGATITRYDVDAAAGTLARRDSIALPSVVQYAWPHPTNRYLYACTSDGAPGGAGPVGHLHRLVALKLGADGALALHGEPAMLTERPIHNSVDATGRFALTCYSNPANLTIHRIAPDGTLGSQVEEPADLDYGIYPHQVRTFPGNRSVALVTRGNDGFGGRPEDPGAIKLYRFDRGRLSPLASIAVGDRGGLGYGPRHLDFHPTQPWAYVALERQNQIHMHRLEGEGMAARPSFTASTVSGDAGGPHQTLAGAIHVHPRGQVVYVSNRASRTRDVNGRKLFAGGLNSIAVFRIDSATGEPTLIQQADPQGYYVRTFSVDPTGTLLVAGTSVAMDVAEGDAVRHVPAGLSLFRIAPDGWLTYLRRYDVALGPDEQQLWVRLLATA